MITTCEKHGCEHVKEHCPECVKPKETLCMDKFIKPEGAEIHKGNCGKLRCEPCSCKEEDDQEPEMKGICNRCGECVTHFMIEKDYKHGYTVACIDCVNKSYEKPASGWVEFESVFDSKKCGFNKDEFSARRLEPHTHRDRDAITIHLRSKYPPFVSDMIAVYGTLAEVMDKIR